MKIIISIDYASKEGDYTCMIYWRKNKKGEQIIEKVDCINSKGGEKVRPYLEVKVVKVKKEGDFWCGGIRIGDKQYKVFKRKEGIPYLKEFKKGNWVNGENLDKIKFPVPCSYMYLGEKGYGMLNKSFRGDGMYELHSLKQREIGICNRVTYSGSLKHLITVMDIHILKGKIILFEEE